MGRAVVEGWPARHLRDASALPQRTYRPSSLRGRPSTPPVLRVLPPGLCSLSGKTGRHSAPTCHRRRTFGGSLRRLHRPVLRQPLQLRLLRNTHGLARQPDMPGRFGNSSVMHDNDYISACGVSLPMWTVCKHQDPWTSAPSARCCHTWR